MRPFPRLRTGSGGPGAPALVASRLGCTEGQVYTMALGLTFAIVLLFALPGTLGGVPEVAAAQRSAALGSEAPESATPPTVGPFEPPLGATGTSWTTDAPSAGPPGTVGPWPGPPSDRGPEEPREPEEPEPPCPPADAARPVVEALNQSGFFPSDSAMLLLERVSGCSQTNPAVLLIGVLAELGSRLPDPGVRIPPPFVPYVDIPQPILDLVQPFREATDPICAGLAQVYPALFYSFGTWPAGVDQAILTPYRQVLLVCGQIQAG